MASRRAMPPAPQLEPEKAWSLNLSGCLRDALGIQCGAFRQSRVLACDCGCLYTGQALGHMCVYVHACGAPEDSSGGIPPGVTLVQVRGDRGAGGSRYCSWAFPEDGVLPRGGRWGAQEGGGVAAATRSLLALRCPVPAPPGVGTDPVWVEGQAADGADALAHEAVVVLDAVDELPRPAVDGGELVHGAAAGAEGGCQRLLRGRGRGAGSAGTGVQPVGLGTYQAMRLAWGWMSRAVSPFTICSTLTDSGIRGSKKRTSPFTLPRGGRGEGGRPASPGTGTQRPSGAS